MVTERKFETNLKLKYCYPTILQSNTFQRVGYTLVFLMAISVSVVAQTIPELWGTRVHDEANVLSHEAIDRLESELTAYEDSTSNQIAILIIPTLGETPLEEYSLKVAEKWKLGQTGKDNGALLLIAVNDHKIRIEVGYGLEGLLTDAITSRIIRNEIAPRFRKNDFNGGVTAGVDAMVKAIGGEYTAEDDFAELGIIPRILIGLFVFSILGVFTVFAIIIPGWGSWVLYVFLIPFYTFFPMIIFGFAGGIVMAVVYVVTLPIIKVLASKSSWGKSLSKSMGVPSTGGGGWSGGSRGSSGGFSSRSSGGFSGGGGSFGGGGSSGSW